MTKFPSVLREREGTRNSHSYLVFNNVMFQVVLGSSMPGKAASLVLIGTFGRCRDL